MPLYKLHTALQVDKSSQSPPAQMVSHESTHTSLLLPLCTSMPHQSILSSVFPSSLDILTLALLHHQCLQAEPPPQALTLAQAVHHPQALKAFPRGQILSPLDLILVALCLPQVRPPPKGPHVRLPQMRLNPTHLHLAQVGLRLLQRGSPLLRWA